MQNDIDYRRISEFYLLQRRRLKNLKKVEIKANGMILSGYDLQNSLVPFASDLMVSNNEVVIPKDNNMLKACLDLGSYISANPNLISDFAEWFIRWKNEQSQIIEYKVNKNITSDKKLLEAYPDVNESVKTTYEIEAKYANDKKLERLLKNWFEEVGIDIDDIKEYEEQPIIDMRIMLDIFKFCKDNYEFYLQVQNNEFLPFTIHVGLHVSFENGKKIIKSTADDLDNAIKFLILSNYDNLKRCEYCSYFFQGRRDRNCCSTRCRDLRNKKYEKRKEREKRSDTIC